MIDFTHRLEDYNYKSPEKFELEDCVIGATSRAQSIISIIQGDFVDGRNELNNQTIFSALDAVRLECIDIQKIVEHYCSEGKPLKK